MLPLDRNRLSRTSSPISAPARSMSRPSHFLCRCAYSTTRAVPIPPRRRRPLVQTIDGLVVERMRETNPRRGLQVRRVPASRWDQASFAVQTVKRNSCWHFGQPNTRISVSRSAASVRTRRIWLPHRQLGVSVEPGSSRRSSITSSPARAAMQQADSTEASGSLGSSVPVLTTAVRYHFAALRQGHNCPFSH